MVVMAARTFVQHLEHRADRAGLAGGIVDAAHVERQFGGGEGDGVVLDVEDGNAVRQFGVLHRREAGGLGLADAGDGAARAALRGDDGGLGRVGHLGPCDAFVARRGHARSRDDHAAIARTAQPLARIGHDLCRGQARYAIRSSLYLAGEPSTELACINRPPRASIVSLLRTAGMIRVAL